LRSAALAYGFVAIEFADGHANEERWPDVLYEFVREK
jgi:hypothetical protein